MIGLGGDLVAQTWSITAPISSHDHGDTCPHRLHAAPRHNGPRTTMNTDTGIYLLLLLLISAAGTLFATLTTRRGPAQRTSGCKWITRNSGASGSMMEQWEPTTEPDGQPLEQVSMDHRANNDAPLLGQSSTEPKSEHDDLHTDQQRPQGPPYAIDPVLSSSRPRAEMRRSHGVEEGSANTRSRLRSNMGSALLSLCILASQIATAQRYNMTTQAPGGFLVFDEIAVIDGAEVIACGNVEQGYRYGALCRMNNGVTTWAKKLRNTAPFHANAFYTDLCITATNDILVAGQEVLSMPHCHLARLNGSGDLLWSTSVNLGPGQQHFSEVMEASDGSIYAVGSKGDFAQADVVVAKFDPVGDLIWVRIVNEPDEQYAYDATLANDTLQVLASTADNSGDIAVLSFNSDGELLRSLSLGTMAYERPLAMTADNEGGLLLSWGRDYYDMFITKLPSEPGTELPTWSIDTPLQLDLQAGIYFDPAIEECILLGNRASMAYALRMSLSSSTVVWERSFPDFYSFFGMTLTNGGTKMVASGGPFGFAPNGSYPVEFAEFDPITGQEVGTPCAPGSASAISVSETTTPCTMVTRDLIIPPVSISHDTEIEELLVGTSYCGMTLPIQLLDWSATDLGDAVMLQWSTGSEFNSEAFVIERSKDAQDWHRIGDVQGAGASTTLLNYSWMDHRPFAGVNYYRLRQLDRDGSEQVFHVIAVDRSGQEERLRVHPNPVSANQTVLASHPISLIDLAGRLLAGPTLQLIAPVHPGTYIAHSAFGTERLIVQ